MLDTIRSRTKRRSDIRDSKMHGDIFAPRAMPGSVPADAASYMHRGSAICLGRSGPFGWRGRGRRKGGWSGLRAFTIIHVNCPQHARSCPKSHAPWLHFAAGQTFRTVSESVLRRADSTGHYRLRAANANPLCVREVRFFYMHFYVHFAPISIFVNLMADTRHWGVITRRFADVECD